MCPVLYCSALFCSILCPVPCALSCAAGSLHALIGCRRQKSYIVHKSVTHKDNNNSNNGNNNKNNTHTHTARAAAAMTGLVTAAEIADDVAAWLHSCVRGRGGCFFDCAIVLDIKALSANRPTASSQSACAASSEALPQPIKAQRTRD